MTASWVIREKATKVVVMETFDKYVVAALNTNKYEAVPTIDYLRGLNANQQPSSTLGKASALVEAK